MTYFLSTSVQRIHQLAFLELSSFLLSRVHIASEHLEALFPSLSILLVVEIVLVEILFIRDERPSIPIFEHKLVPEARHYSC